MCQPPSQNSFNPFYNQTKTHDTCSYCPGVSMPGLSGPKPRPDPAQPGAFLEQARGHSRRPLSDPRELYTVQPDTSAASFILSEPESLWTLTCPIKNGWTLSRTTNGKVPAGGCDIFL